MRTHLAHQVLGGYPYIVQQYIGILGMEANTSSNTLNPIADGAYSLLGIIKLGPSHTSGIKG